MKKISFISALTASSLGMIALSAFAADPYPAVPFDMPGKADFVKSLNLTAGRHEMPNSSESVKKALAPVYNEKIEQHAATRHAEKGMTCVTCHNPKSIKSPAWMLSVTAPAVQKDCGDCHTTQKTVFAQTDTHAKIDCIACHMPNMPVMDGYAGTAKKGSADYSAIRRAHFYKINVDPKVVSILKNAAPRSGERPWNWALDKDGHAFVDLEWSCARATPADHTTFGAGQGCHSPVTSTLDKDLQYADKAAVAREIAKWQRPVKDAYSEIEAGLKRISKLMEVTKLTFAEQTEVRLMLDKARDIKIEIEKDASWGAHGPRYLKDRALTGLGFIQKAQLLVDKAGFTAK